MIGFLQRISVFGCEEIRRWMGFGDHLSTDACPAEESASRQAGPYYHDHAKNKNTFPRLLVAASGHGTMSLWGNHFRIQLDYQRAIGYMSGEDPNPLSVKELNGHVKEDFVAWDFCGRR
jgi:hypothetical protein